MSIRLEGNDLPKTRVETSCGWWGHEWPHQTTTWPAIRIAPRKECRLVGEDRADLPIFFGNAPELLSTLPVCAVAPSWYDDEESAAWLYSIWAEVPGWSMWHRDHGRHAKRARQMPWLLVWLIQDLQRFFSWPSVGLDILDVGFFNTLPAPLSNKTFWHFKSPGAMRSHARHGLALAITCLWACPLALAEADRLEGYGANNYEPLCAYVCHTAVPSTVECPEFANMTAEERAEAYPGPACLAADESYLTSIAWCINNRCKDGTMPSAIQDFWETKLIYGQDEPGVVLKYATYYEALSRVNTTVEYTIRIPTFGISSLSHFPELPPLYPE
ncbi:hypothetical protein Purlil1_13178 [Purpureocillium lilacinum]|uniref:Uncharacterized protein n=1 Tax=Purpureocillium lilacinum TaxID=33203 RepID=A0ABR0BEU4_PURLI|nr:hypothetical protein Purlil1_13178 [Purpureocillium lilacinum]